ncbi:MAG TPA: glycine zipper 2TM domain-containing protein [Oleiagrimonas sp.]|nr:glycine zipper 2TM domain-containing protein [Oleiagrimonas sp.]
MQMRKNNIRKLAHSWLPALAVVGMLILAGCATRQPYRSGGPYGTTYGGGGYGTNVCTQCGTVQSIRQVYVQDDNQSHVLGTVIGAVAGGLIGNTVGKGDGRKAATVAGAVAGGAVGHEVAEHNSQGQMTAWQVVVRLDNGQFATVTQREAPRAQIGDRVQVRNDHVYLL